MSVEILLTIDLYLQKELEANFKCHRLYAAQDPAAFLKEHASGIRGVATFGKWGADKALIQALPNLEIIANMGVGVDAIDLAEARKRGVIVTNTPDVLNDCVAETTMSLVLNVLHRFPQNEAYLRSGYWATRGGPALAAEAKGKTLGILGLGRIGEKVAALAEAFGMKIRYHNRRKKKVAYAYDPDPQTLAKSSDVLLVATPGGKATEKLVETKVLDALGPEGYLINISRGSVIDEQALIRYLQEQRIAGAALDVYEGEPSINPEFFALQNAVLYPHVGSATHETRRAMGMLQLENLQLHFNGKEVKTPVA
jgi:lactate dehydrogenase-like 2-hydroxyacid dehydrogenase